MNRYRYRAAQDDGLVVSGVIAAAGPADVDALLLGRGLYPLTLEPAPDATRARVSRQELATVFRSLATLVEAGVPLERALNASARLSRQPALRSALSEGRRLLTEGQRLSQALEQGNGMVPPAILGLLNAGERSGDVPGALEQAAAQLEREAELAGRVRQALAYPAILLVAGAGSVAVITTVVVPRFAVILADLGQALPPTTRILIACATFLRAYGFWLFLLIAGAVILTMRWAGTVEGRRKLHRQLAAAPVIGPIRLAFASARACRALSAALATGVPILPALDAAVEAAADSEIASRLGRARVRVAEGQALSTALEAERAFTPTALQVLAVGDTSGQVATMAARAGDLAAAEGEGAMKVAVSLLEPALVVLFGGLVAFTAAALLQAVYSLRPG